MNQIQIFILEKIAAIPYLEVFLGIFFLIATASLLLSFNDFMDKRMPRPLHLIIITLFLFLISLSPEMKPNACFIMTPHDSQKMVVMYRSVVQGGLVDVLARDEQRLALNMSLGAVSNEALLAQVSERRRQAHPIIEYRNGSQAFFLPQEYIVLEAVKNKITVINEKNEISELRLSISSINFKQSFCSDKINEVAKRYQSAVLSYQEKGQL